MWSRFLEKDGNERLKENEYVKITKILKGVCRVTHPV